MKGYRKRTRIVLLGGIAVVTLLGLPRPSAGAAFAPPCPLPYQAALPQNPVDLNAECPPEGTGQRGAHKEQNGAKNNLCATGAPVRLRYQTFRTLQRRADRLKEDGQLKFGSPNSLPEDRSVLRDVLKLPNGPRIGEGTVVRYVAFITNPRYSNVPPFGSGESVNCKLLQNNDIHMDLTREPGELACRSVTAEIIPHFRPPAWERDFLLQVRFRPVRITGQLFFDGSHVPCRTDTDRVSPKRVSLWEIHPVYAIDMCREKTLAGGPANNEARWVPLHVWVNTGEDTNGNDN